MEVDRELVRRTLSVSKFDVDGFSIDWTGSCLTTLNTLMGWISFRVLAHEGPQGRDLIRRGHWPTRSFISLGGNDEFVFLVKKNEEGLLPGQASSTRVNATPLQAHKILVDHAQGRGSMDPQIMDKHLRIASKPYGHSWYLPLPKRASKQLTDLNMSPHTLLSFTSRPPPTILPVQL